MLEHTKRQVHKKFYNMPCLVIFITAVCLLFLTQFTLMERLVFYKRCFDESFRFVLNRSINVSFLKQWAKIPINQQKTMYIDILE